MGSVFLVHFEQSHMTVHFPPLTVQYNSLHCLSGIFSGAHSCKPCTFIPEIKFMLLKC